MQYYLALNRNYAIENYLTKINNKQLRKINVRTIYAQIIFKILLKISICQWEEGLPFLLGERGECILIAAEYVTSCHELRDNP